jgi:hypothetical protein
MNKSTRQPGDNLILFIETDVIFIEKKIKSIVFVVIYEEKHQNNFFKIVLFPFYRRKLKAIFTQFQKTTC